MGQVWETCQFFVSCTKRLSPTSGVTDPLEVFSYVVFVKRHEHSSKAAQVLVEAHGELVLRLGKRPTY